MSSERGIVDEVVASSSPAAAEAPVPSAALDGDSPITAIRPPTTWPRLRLRELWRFREVLLTLVWRDIAVRYKQTSIGIAWAILQPLVTMVIFTLIFGYVGGFQSKGLQYQVFVYSALLPWFYFASSFAMSGTSIVGNRGLVTKVYFPRLMLPLVGVTVPIVDLLVASVVLIGLMIWYSVVPSLALVLVPFFLLMATITALGGGLFFAAVNVRYRDVPYAIPFLLQSLMFLSGVVLPFSQFPEYAQWVLALNPMTAVINGFQWGVVSAPAPELGKTLLSVVAMVIIFVAGLSFFRRSEPKFADTI